MLARLATPVGILAIGPVVGSWLTPLVGRDARLAGLVAGLAPTDAGRAMALTVVLTAVLALLWTGLGLAIRVLRTVDDVLPDATVSSDSEETS